MTAEHPITPPPELVQQWVAATESNDCIGAFPTDFEQRICTAAARWGSDQELEACCHLLWLQGFDVVDDLRAARRPKPPSLKEQAYNALDAYIYGNSDHKDKESAYNTIRRALEQLDD